MIECFQLFSYKIDAVESIFERGAIIDFSQAWRLKLSTARLAEVFRKSRLVPLVERSCILISISFINGVVKDIRTDKNL